jgi:hypothetical protein
MVILKIVVVAADETRRKSGVYCRGRSRTMCSRIVSLKHTDIHYCDINSKVRYDVDDLLLLLSYLRYAQFG